MDEIDCHSTAFLIRLTPAHIVCENRVGTILIDKNVLKQAGVVHNIKPQQNN